MDNLPIVKQLNAMECEVNVPMLPCRYCGHAGTFHIPAFAAVDGDDDTPAGMWDANVQCPECEATGPAACARRDSFCDTADEARGLAVLAWNDTHFDGAMQAYANDALRSLERATSNARYSGRTFDTPKEWMEALEKAHETEERAVAAIKALVSLALYTRAPLKVVGTVDDAGVTVTNHKLHDPEPRN